MANEVNMTEFIGRLQKAVPKGTITRVWEWDKNTLLIESPELDKGKDQNCPYYIMDVHTAGMRSFNPVLDFDHWDEIMDHPVYTKPR